MNQRSFIAWIVSLVWAALYIRKIIEPEFPVPAEVTPVMLVVAGALFGKDIRDRILGNGKEVDKS